MLRKAFAASRGQPVAAADLWSEHGELTRQVADAEAELARLDEAADEQLLSGSAESRKQTRAKRRELEDNLADLRRARSMAADKARAASERETKAAHRQAWATVESLAKRRLALLSKIDRMIAEIGAAYVESEALEREISRVVPRAHRPRMWPSGGWGGEIGRAIAFRLKLAQPAIDALVAGSAISVLSDFPSLSTIGERAHATLIATQRPKQEGEE